MRRFGCHVPTAEMLRIFIKIIFDKIMIIKKMTETLKCRKMNVVKWISKNECRKKLPCIPIYRYRPHNQHPLLEILRPIASELL